MNLYLRDFDYEILSEEKLRRFVEEKAVQEILSLFG